MQDLEMRRPYLEEFCIVHANKPGVVLGTAVFGLYCEIIVGCLSLRRCLIRVARNPLSKLTDVRR